MSLTFLQQQLTLLQFFNIVEFYCNDFIINALASDFKNELNL